MTGRPGTAPGVGRVRLHKRGRWWYARFTDQGKRHEVALKCVNRVPAENKARRINDALEADQPWEWAIGRAQEGSWTFTQAVEEYLDKGSRWGTKTRQQNRSTVKRLVAEFGRLPLSKITERDIAGYLARLRDEGLSVASRNRYLCTIKAILGKAADWGQLERNPAAQVKTEPEGKKAPHPFRPDEVERLLEVLPPQPRRVMEVYLQTGMRRGELADLVWSDVDFTNNLLTIRQPKNKRDRSIPMSRRVREILADRRREWQRESVIAGDLRVFGRSADILRALHRAADQANLDEGRRGRLQHRLRDTFITHLVEKGIPLDRVQVLAGHNSIEMTRRYAETRPEALRTAIEQVFG